MIVFVDFDGVLHPEGCTPAKHFMHAENLFQCLESYHVELVISSTWRERQTLETLKDKMGKLGSMVIDVTPSYKDIDLSSYPERIHTYHRHIECLEWMRRNRKPWDLWLAIDDRSYLFTPFFKDVVLCEPSVGITPQTLLNLQENLSIVRKTTG